MITTHYHGSPLLWAHDILQFIKEARVSVRAAIIRVARSLENKSIDTRLRELLLFRSYGQWTIAKIASIRWWFIDENKRKRFDVHTHTKSPGRRRVDWPWYKKYAEDSIPWETTKVSAFEWSKRRGVPKCTLASCGWNGWASLQAYQDSILGKGRKRGPRTPWKHMSADDSRTPYRFSLEWGSRVEHTICSWVKWADSLCWHMRKLGVLDPCIIIIA